LVQRTEGNVFFSRVTKSLADVLFLLIFVFAFVSRFFGSEENDRFRLSNFFIEFYPSLFFFFEFG